MILSKTQCGIGALREEPMPTTSRNTDTITFSLPLETARELREVAQEEQRAVSELLREAIRLYMEERDWRIRERRERRRLRKNEQEQ